MTEVICESFEVKFANGETRAFMKGDDSEYQWSLTPSGDLLIYYKEFHKTFTMAAIKDQRIAAYGTGVWSEVVVLSTDEEGESLALA